MSSNRPAIAAEIQAALTQHGTLTSAELVDCCPSADDREIVSKVIYQMRQSGVIEKAGTVPGAPGRGSKQVNQWRLTAAEPIPATKEEEPMPSVHMKFPATTRFDAPGADCHPAPGLDDIERLHAPEPPCDGVPGSQYQQRLHDEFMADDSAATKEATMASTTRAYDHTESPLGGTYEFNHVAPTRLEAPGGVDGPSAIDPTEEALSNLVDQADEAVLALADSLLSDHPVWSRLRALQSDTFQALCDWRLRSYLSTQDKEPNQ